MQHRSLGDDRDGLPDLLYQRNMTRELCGCPVVQDPVRTTYIIFLPPLLDEVLCFGQCLEPVGVQALCPEGSVERFAEGIVGRFAGTGEVDLHLVTISPHIHHLACELAAVVTEQDLRHPTFELQLIQRAHHVFSSQALTCFDSQALPRVNIHDGQSAEASAIAELIGDEVHRPNLVRAGWLEPLLTMHDRTPPPSWPFTQSQPFFLVQPVHQVLAYLPALVIQQHTDHAVAIWLD